MALLSSNRIAWTYTDEDGVDWRVAAVKAITDQNKLGGSAALISVPPKPKWLKMRRITVRNVAQNASRVVPVYSAGAPIQTAGETVNLNHLNVDSYAFTSQGATLPEERPRQNVTSQAT